MPRGEASHGAAGVGPRPLGRDQHTADFAFCLLQFLGGRGALRLRVLGDAQAVLNRGHERGIRLLHGLDVENAALELGARLQIAFASASAGIAKILFIIFLVLFLLSLIFGAVRGV